MFGAQINILFCLDIPYFLSLISITHIQAQNKHPHALNHPQIHTGSLEQKSEKNKLLNDHYNYSQTDYKRLPLRPPFLRVLSEGTGVTS